MTNRRLLAVAFLSGCLGTVVELLLMDHTEGVWQKVPLVLLAAGCVLWAISAATNSAPMRRLFLATMVLFAAAGVLGVILHFNGNMEFERELSPGTEGLELFRKAVTGATPALAPGTMLLLAAVGWAHSRASRQE